MGHCSIGAYDGYYNSANTVDGTAITFVIADPRAASPDFTSDVMLTDLELSVADPNAVLHMVVGRVELSSTVIGGTGGHYFRDTPSGGNLPGIAQMPFTQFHHIHAAYFLSGGHPLQIHFDEPLEAFRDAESGTDQGIGIWLKREDSTSAVEFHLNARYEVNS